MTRKYSSPIVAVWYGGNIGARPYHCWLYRIIVRQGVARWSLAEKHVGGMFYDDQLLMRLNPRGQKPATGEKLQPHEIAGLRERGLIKTLPVRVQDAIVAAIMEGGGG